MSDGVSQMLLEQDLLEEALKALIPFRAKVEIQYKDYEENQWTVASQLTEQKANELTHDFSVSYLRIIIKG